MLVLPLPPSRQPLRAVGPNLPDQWPVNPHQSPPELLLMRETKENEKEMLLFLVWSVRHLCRSICESKMAASSAEAFGNFTCYIPIHTNYAQVCNFMRIFLLRLSSISSSKCNHCWADGERRRVLAAHAGQAGTYAPTACSPIDVAFFLDQLIAHPLRAPVRVRVEHGEREDGERV